MFGPLNLPEILLGARKGFFLSDSVSKINNNNYLARAHLDPIGGKGLLIRSHGYTTGESCDFIAWNCGQCLEFDRHQVLALTQAKLAQPQYVVFTRNGQPLPKTSSVEVPYISCAVLKSSSCSMGSLMPCGIRAHTYSCMHVRRQRHRLMRPCMHAPPGAAAVS